MAVYLPGVFCAFALLLGNPNGASGQPGDLARREKEAETTSEVRCTLETATVAQANWIAGQLAEVSGGVAHQIRRFGPHIGGPLAPAIADTFVGSAYNEVIVGSQEIELYRVVGSSDDAIKLGSWWSRTPPAGRLQARMDLAIAEHWSDASRVVKIRVPQSARFYEGCSAAQPSKIGLKPTIGGGNQVYFPPGTVIPQWVVPFP